ncbi:hypothetical protein [Parahaliea mediterranea]|uniref:hypothetical protein n=1 Tax=Parahaliea mediterranea TaxID=651086 RepID=UPI000E2F775F|nr:hypothetical protein [Parahaliea mediterranea]
MTATRSSALDVLTRVVAAGPGGYCLSMIVCIWLVRLLQLSSQEGRQLVNVLFFVVYLLVIMWVFAVARSRTAALGVALPTLALFGLHRLVAGEWA